MTIGRLGDILFEISPTMIQTIKKLEHSGSARISNHDIHLQKSLPEFTGSDPEKVTLQMRVSTALGSDPDSAIEKIRGYTASGAALRLQIGRRSVGSYRWLINSFKMTYTDCDRNGNLIDADISVTLMEYPR